MTIKRNRYEAGEWERRGAEGRFRTETKQA